MTTPIQNKEVQQQIQIQESRKLKGSSDSADFALLLQDASKKKAESKEERIHAAVLHAAGKYDLPPALILAVIKQESGFNPKAQSHCGAKGLMQLMPGTAKLMGVKNINNIEENIDGGSRYLREMLDRFDGDLKCAIAAYNAGPGAVEKHGGIPPYRETKQYVPAVLAHYKSFSGSTNLGTFDVPKKPANDLLLFAAAPAISSSAVAANTLMSVAIASRPIDLPQPERNRKSENDEPPPPPPPRLMMRV